MGELLPCPFCGGQPHIDFSHEAGRWDVYEFECDCGISAYGPCGHEGDEAKNATVRKWNARTNPRLANSEEMVELRERVADDMGMPSPIKPKRTSAMTPTDADGYATAFYEIAAMLGIPAQSKAPREVWEQQMKPRLIAALQAMKERGDDELTKS